MHPSAKGATIELNMPSKEGKVTKTAGDKILFFDVSFEFGDSNTLKRWDKLTCPIYIVTHSDEGDWYEFDEKLDLSFYTDIPDLGLQIFRNDNPAEETYTCTYDGFKILFNAEGKAMLVMDNPSNVTYNLDSSLTEFPADEPGKCENVITCKVTNVPAVAGSSGYRSYMVYSDSIQFESKKESECTNNITTGFQIEYKEQQSEENGDNPACRTYTNHFYLMESALYNCDPNKSVISCGFYNNYKTKLKTYCGNITSYMDYGDKCLEYCLTLNDEIAILENDFSTKLY